MSADPFRLLVEAAAEPYRRAGRFAHGFARGKLGGDPVFRHLIVSGALASAPTVLDLGCGQGLLASLLQAARARALADAWPERWAAAPVCESYTGIELMPRDLQRARQALGDGPRFVEGDIADLPLPRADAVVILDVLHYLPFEAQRRVLERVRTAIEPAGVLLLRVGDAEGGLRFAASRWVDRIVTRVRGHRLQDLYCRPLTEWCRVLQQMGFDPSTRSMSEGTAFANVLITALPCPLPPTADRDG